MDLDTETQKSVQEWWGKFPMTYGRHHGTSEYGDSVTPLRLGTPEFFQRADITFYQWTQPLHGPDGPFSRIFPYRRYVGKRVLEIGCGLGCMSSNWARQGARVTAIDLNFPSVGLTAERFRISKLTGNLLQADARTLPFRSSAFDYVYSWGVLHHSPKLEVSLQEFLRVLASGGEFGLMLYNRESLLYRYQVKWTEGFLHGEARFLDELSLASRYGDGAEQEGNPHTWPVTKRELTSMLAPSCENLEIRLLGTEFDSILEHLIPLPKVKNWIPRSWRKPWARRWGWSIWATGKKR